MSNSLPDHNQLEGFDIIGDVHGCAEPLRSLLEKLGYIEKDNAFQYPGNKRHVIFLGDLVDRGPEIPAVINISRAMHKAGSATVVMGNHELNAIAFNTMIDGKYIRSRKDRVFTQTQETMRQIEAAGMNFSSVVEWFKTFPLFIDHPDFRVIHACWDQELLDAYVQEYKTPYLVERWDLAFDKESILHRFIERSTRGVSLNLPDGRSIMGYDGFMRKAFRVGFWESEPETYEDIIFQPDPLPEDILSSPVSHRHRSHMTYYANDQKPLFIGHYWLSGEPALVADNICCLDYSAVNGGSLVAYRWNLGDVSLSNERFISVKVQS